MEERLLLEDHLQNKTFPADLPDCKTPAHFSARFCAHFKQDWGLQHSYSVPLQKHTVAYRLS